jgi:hypothetical protein
MVIILGQAKNYKPPLTILGQNVGEKFIYIYQGKKDGYIWGKTEKLNHPPHSTTIMGQRSRGKNMGHDFLAYGLF